MSQPRDILVIEDDPICQETYVEALASTHSRVSFCSSKFSAKMAVGLFKPDTVFVDLGLSDGDGLQVISTLREELTGFNPRIFVVTGTTSPARHQAALAAGADQVMVKPIDPPSLLSLLGTH